MIKLTRLNKTALAVNADLIKFVENAPDTVVTLTTGEKIVVRETADQIIHLVMTYRRALLTGTEGVNQSAGPSNPRTGVSETVKDEDSRG